MKRLFAVVVPPVLALTAAAQEVHRLRDVHKVYVAPLTGNAGDIVREQIVGNWYSQARSCPWIRWSRRTRN
jgi:hypothetical protein